MWNSSFDWLNLGFICLKREGSLDNGYLNYHNSDFEKKNENIKLNFMEVIIEFTINYFMQFK
jgi:hypothetical protein